MHETNQGDRAPALTGRPHVQWFHGSPNRLATLKAGSTVTPIVTLAKAFSHKPSDVKIELREADGRRRVRIMHNGKQSGHLYRVVVENAATDLRQHPGSTGALGEEVLTTRDLLVEWMEEVPLTPAYESIEGEEPAQNGVQDRPASSLP